MSDDEPTRLDGGDAPAPVGVKLGSTRTVLDLPDGNGTRERHSVLTRPATDGDETTGEERARFGHGAPTERPETERFMLRSGLPVDAERVADAKRFLAALVDAHDVPANSAVVYAVPTVDTETGIRNLKVVIEGSEIGQAAVRCLPESLCGAIPAFGDGLDAIDEVFVSVNTGATTLTACAYRRGEQLSPFSTESVTGTEVDRRIAAAIDAETEGRVHVDRTTAREYKEEHADVSDFEPFTDVVNGPDGDSREFTVDRAVREPVERYIDDAVDAVANEFLPELATDHLKSSQIALGRPVVVTGGMACIPGLAEAFEHRLSEELDRDIEVITPDDPAEAATEGAARVATRLVFASPSS
ncbi:rod shape-determining protein [Halorubrum sp. DTA98]|uniref:rod shape-determining protein n=1 Tax=Halorubrum sp. DTA98 TaxID=3402163 RepID=UPI003AB0F069